jgi:hypothetical protein
VILNLELNMKQSRKREQIVISLKNKCQLKKLLLKRNKDLKMSLKQLQVIYNQKKIAIRMTLSKRSRITKKNKKMEKHHH